MMETIFWIEWIVVVVSLTAAAIFYRPTQIGR